MTHDPRLAFRAALAAIAEELELTRSGQVMVLVEEALMIAGEGPCEHEIEEEWEELAAPLHLLSHAIVQNMFDCEDRELTAPREDEEPNGMVN